MHLQQKVQRYGSLLLSKSSTLQFHMRLITAGLPHCVQINDTTLRTPRSGLHSDPPLSGLSPSPLLSPPFVLPWCHPPLSSVWWGFDLAWVPPLPLFVLPSHFGCRPFCVPVAFRSLSFLCPLCSRFVVVCSWDVVLLCWCRFGLGSSFSLAPSLSLRASVSLGPLLPLPALLSVPRGLLWCSPLLSPLCENTRAAWQLFFTARTWAKPHRFDSSVTLLLRRVVQSKTQWHSNVFKLLKLLQKSSQASKTFFQLLQIKRLQLKLTNNLQNSYQISSQHQVPKTWVKQHPKTPKTTKTNENPSPSSSMHKLVPFGSKLVPTWFL